jgi:hypothetical protein
MTVCQGGNLMHDSPCAHSEGLKISSHSQLPSRIGLSIAVG